MHRGSETGLRGALVLALLASLALAVEGYDKYLDALEKYAKWQEQYGTVRAERNTPDILRRGDIFIPHRPVHSTLDPVYSEQEQAGQGDLVRGVRNPLNNVVELGVGGREYITPSGLPLYKWKKKYPLGYSGRKRRSTHQGARVKRQQGGWVILDPNTGRPIQGGPEPSVAVRTVRRPTDFANFFGENGNNGLQEQPLAPRTSLEQQPTYKYYKKYPYSG